MTSCDFPSSHRGQSQPATQDSPPIGVAEFIAIDENREFSRRVLTSVTSALSGKQFHGVRTIAIAGSFGRHEASVTSDADFIVVLNDDTNPSNDERRAVEASVVDAVAIEFEKFGIARPNPQGVFAAPRTMGEILPALQEGGFGKPDEPADLMGKRQLLLLESQPLWASDEYNKVIDEIFERYSSYVLTDPTKEHIYLLNDLIRYFRYICINYQSTWDNENEKWAIRNVKLRHSRLLMYAGLLVLIGESSKFKDERKISTVRDGLLKTPLERLESVYETNEDWTYFKLLGAYNTFLMRLSDPTVRIQLNAIEYSRRYQNPLFATLKANSDFFQGELARFIYARRGQWSDRFFEYLIF